MDGWSMGIWAALIGLLAGGVLGLAARLGDFCTLGALESSRYGGDQSRLRMWGLALATAIALSHLGDSFGLINLQATMYHDMAWNPVASIFGGLIFGYGMALAGNCGFGALARFGGGDLRSLIVVAVIGITGFMTLAGPIAPLRIALFPQKQAVAEHGITHNLAQLGIPPLLSALIIAALLAVWALSYSGLRERPNRIFWGIAVGLTIAGSLLGTSYLNDLSLDVVPVEGPSFTAPIGRTLIYLMTATAGGMTFSVGSVVGVVVGAFLGSIIRGWFKWEACDDPRELGRQTGGAALMGIGGVIAMGCTIGQGMTGFTTLAWSGPVTLLAIAIGGRLGLRQLIGDYKSL